MNSELIIVKIKKHAFARMVCFLVLFTLMMCMSEGLIATFNSYSGEYNRRLEINFKSDLLEGGKKVVALNEMQKIVEGFGAESVSYAREINTLAVSSTTAYYVNAVLTTHNYINFLSLKVFKGSFLTKDACEVGRRTAIISDTLAQKMFSTYDVIGKEIHLLDGEKYSITGVYKARKSIISFWGEDGKERVYIPFTSYSKAHDTQVSTIILKDNVLEKEGLKAYIVETKLRDILGLDKKYYRITDYYFSQTVLSQFKAILIFFIGVWGIWIFIVYVINYLKRNYTKFKDSLAEKYFWEAVKNEKIWTAKMLSVMLLAVLGIVLVYQTIKFNLYIPQQYIPAENIFDIQFYIKQLESAVNLSNSREYVFSQFDIYFANALKLNLILLILSFVGFLLSLSCIKLAGMAGADWMYMTKSIGISVFISIVLYIITALVFGIEFVLPMKELVVVLLFINLYYKRGANKI